MTEGAEGIAKIDPADAAIIADPLAYGEWHELQKTFARLRQDMPVWPC